MTGTVSHYRIVRELGGGGMGVVYVAEDIRLGRRVALKFLPDHLARSPEALERFAREARTASSLNHPNICTLFDIGESEGKPFLVMELLEGENLKQRLARGAVPAAELLEWGVQIGGALQAAHSQGVVHRDIKPANLFIVRGGRVKVLDFGLAKPLTAGPPMPVGESAPTLTMLPSFQSSPGSAAGTLGYMSPEQARGEEIDARTDLFSFGAVLYEMATGHEPFPGATSAVVFDAILNRDPEPLRRRQPAASPELERVVGKALEKDRELRYQSAADLVADLQRLRRNSSSASRPAAGSRARPRRSYLGAVAALGLAVLVAAGALWWSARRTPPPPLVPVKVTGNPADLPVQSAVLSPDGRFLAYSDRLGVHIRSSDTGESRALPETAGMITVEWSGDSTQLFAVRSLGSNDFSVWTIPLLGGPPRAGPRGLPSPDGRYLVTAAGIESADGSRSLVRHCRVDQIAGFGWSPDSKRVAIAQTLPGASPMFTVEVVEPDTRKSVTVVRSDVPIAGAAWLSNTRMVYARMEPAPPFRDFNLWTIDLGRRLDSRPSEPKRLTRWASFLIKWVSATSDGKRLALIKDDTQYNVDIARLEAGGTRISPPQRLTLDDHYNNATAWMPDNRAVLFESDRTGGLHIYRQELDSPNPELLIGGPSQQFQARLSPDQRWLLYLEAADPKPSQRRARLMRMPLSGGPAVQVLSTDTSVRAFYCSLPPRSTCVMNELRGNEEIVSQFDLTRGRGPEITRNPLGVGDAAISPDGARIALAFGDPRNRIRVLTLEGKTEKEITVVGATRLVGLDWTADGRSFLCGDVSAATSSLLRVELSGKSLPLWAQPGNHAIWAVPSRDGGLLALQGATESANVWTVENR
ncbi:MAG: protein kinase [Acidobacteriia bacterium]|nr:protein kinase [Terriglobia bacterium]